jgi:hypothetical protein
LGGVGGGGGEWDSGIRVNKLGFADWGAGIRGYKLGFADWGAGQVSNHCVLFRP